jgi:hypothetical protein
LSEALIIFCNKNCTLLGWMGYPTFGVQFLLGFGYRIT